jgi:hypothetical protein
MFTVDQSYVKIVSLLLFGALLSSADEIPPTKSAPVSRERSHRAVAVGIEEAGADLANLVGHVQGISRLEPTESADAALVRTDSVGTGLSYTCDAAISALAGVCAALNTTIASLYTNIFSDVSAKIYIKLGSTGLAQSTSVINLVDYSAFRSSLGADQTDSNDATAFSSSVPLTNPINSTYLVWLTNANARALGISVSWGLKTDGSTFCTIGTQDCYDGIITVSSLQQTQGHLFFRTGTITSTQYDFYTVVEHETDEILGTASCAFPICNSSPEGIHPADLFRYSSNGSRSFAAGNNNPCSSPTAGNACFSLDGVTMLQAYNNLNNGQDAGDWVTSCVAPLVQNAVGCRGIAGVDISPAAEILVLDVVGYNLVQPTMVSPSGQTGGAQTFTGQYFASSGYQDLKWVQLLFAVATNGGGQAFCYIHYDVVGNKFWLYSDVQGIFVGPVTPGTASNFLQGSLCALNTSASSVNGSGNNLTVNVAVVFKEPLALNIYMRAQTMEGVDTGWLQRGTWTAAAAPSAAMTVSPSSGGVAHGTPQTFTLTFPDPSGFAGLPFGWEQFLVAVAPDGGGQPYCYVHYDRSANALWMYSSDLGVLLGPVTPGTSSNLLSSSACSINTAGATVQNVSGNLVLTVPITLKTPMVGSRKLFQRTLTVLNVDTGFVQTGTLAVN